MTSAGDVAATIQRKTSAVAKSLDPQAQRRLLTPVGLQAKEDVARAVRRTPVKTPGRSLSDGGMSGFGNKPITARYRFIDDETLNVTPMGRMTGQMSILESGRRAYQAGTVRRLGMRTTKKAGLVGRLRGVTRNVGAQAGKGTWTAAKRLMAQSAPRVYRRAVRQNVTRAFRS